MKIPVAALPLVLVLAACGGTPAPNADPVAAACRAEARAAPGAMAMDRQLNVANANNVYRLEQERAQAESRAFSDCLRARGVSRGGGVEPVRGRGL